MKIPNSESSKSMILPARCAADQDNAPLPFAGLGFDLSAVLSRPIRLIRREAHRPPAAPIRMIDIPAPAGRVLLVRLNREIRGS
jgi:hypothetical protein